MITIFSHPRPFKGDFIVPQLNAIKSWKAAIPDVEIFIINDEENTSESIAKELNVNVIVESKFSEFGTPLLNNAFELVQQRAKYDIIAYINTDIIVTSHFLTGIDILIREFKDRSFYGIGRRWDLDMFEEVDYKAQTWEKRLLELAHRKGNLHRFSGMDYWIFPKLLNFNMPPFAVGRPGYDSWLVYKAREMGIPIVDCSKIIQVIHQNHYYPQSKDMNYDTELERNVLLAGGYANLMTIYEATLQLDKIGVTNLGFLRNIISKLAMNIFWRKLKAFKRNSRFHVKKPF